MNLPAPLSSWLKSAQQALLTLTEQAHSTLTPPEFSITPPALPASWGARIEALIKEPSPGDAIDPDAFRALGELGVFVWRMQKRAAQTDAPLERKTIQSIDRIATQLTEMGVVIQDYTGKRFITGLDIDVRAFQPNARVTEETVADTLRPAVFFKSHHIVRGDVLVDTPVSQPS